MTMPDNDNSSSSDDVSVVEARTQPLKNESRW